MAEAPDTGAAPTLAAATFEGLCPRCGAQTLFYGIASFAPKCSACGLDFSAYNVGDGPALFLILIISIVVIVAGLMVDAYFAPPWWVHLVWVPVTIALTLGGLRLGKAALIFLEHHHRAGEGRIVP